MTTHMKNIDYAKELNAFRDKQTKVEPIKILFAMADLLRSNEPSWLKTKEAKALVHYLNKQIYGVEYKIDGKKEQIWLEQTIS